MKKLLVLLAFLLPGWAAAGVYDDMLAALKAGDTPAAVALLNRGVDPNTLLRRARVNARNRHGDTALRLAALEGKLPFVQRLVEAGAEVNMHGWSPLSYAAFNGHAPVVEYLLRRGADVDA
ncbi:MAG: ankyrin repeat domain-containing protein, partial [Proteobacteria bacterium]|nr:ankyrin repeat domain-containing protein [Pseudomonadota bacterium]